MVGTAGVVGGTWLPPPHPAKPIARLTSTIAVGVFCLICCMTASSSLISFIVSVVASGAHRVSRHVIGNRSAQGVCAYARGSEVNAAKDAGVDDFRYRFREARIRTNARTYFGGDGKRCVLSKRGGKDERGCSTQRGMS